MLNLMTHSSLIYAAATYAALVALRMVSSNKQAQFAWSVCKNRLHP